MAHTHRPRGFTLIELMIAIALMLVLMGVVTYGFTTSQRASNRALNVLDISNAMAPALALLERDVANAALYDKDVVVQMVDVATGAITAPDQSARPENRLWFRAHESDNGRLQRCELVFLTAMPLDRDGDGRADLRQPFVWVRWVAERENLDDDIDDPGRYRLLLTRQLARFAEDHYHQAPGTGENARGEGFERTIALAANFRSREVAGEESGTADPNKSNYDPDRFFGARQVLYEVRETPTLKENQAPPWRLFPLSPATEAGAEVGNSGDDADDVKDRQAAVDGFAPMAGYSTPAHTTTTDRWKEAMGVHVELEAYAPNGLEQSKKYRQTFLFPAAPVDIP